jgi:cell division protein FtsB
VTEPKAPRFTPAQVHRRRTAALRVTATLVIVVGLLFVVVFPVQAWLDQRATLEQDRTQLEQLREERVRLERRAAQLEDPAEVERLARERFGMVRPGEQPYVAVPESTSTTLPVAP